MLVLGVATSHAPATVLPVEHWPEAYQRMRRDVPQPSAAEEETASVIAEAKVRIDAAIEVLSDAIAAADVDVVIVVGDDQNEVFGAAFNPTLAVYCGEAASGNILPRFADKPGVDREVEFKGSPSFAEALSAGLVERGFDPAVMKELRPLTSTHGIGHAFTRPVHFLGLAESGVPVVPVFLNTYHDPLPSARRCYDLGLAIRDVLESRPERVALVASGGLSHDPLGPRAGWIDERLDSWVLDRISSGRSEELTNLFTVDSDSLRGGTGEIRAWVVVAAAFAGVSASVVSYIPIHHAVTGLSFALFQSAAEPA